MKARQMAAIGDSKSTNENEIRNKNHDARPAGYSRALQKHANKLWVADHLTDAQAAAFALNHFRRQVEAELAMVTSAVFVKSPTTTATYLAISRPGIP
jgi:hypothetical protein